MLLLVVSTLAFKVNYLIYSFYFCCTINILFFIASILDFSGTWDGKGGNEVFEN